MKKLFLSPLFLSCFCMAAPQPAPVFQSNMVLQRDKPIPIWGQAQAGSTVNITWQGQTRPCTADAQGQWHLQLPACKANAKGQSMSISDASGSIRLNNILMGDLWLASGQSNMELPMRAYADTKQMTKGIDNEQIRILNVKARPCKPEELKKASPHKQECAMHWQLFTSANTQLFSATASCFAMQLQKELNIPIGIICNAYSGSLIESWLPKQLIDKEEQYKNLRGNQWLNTPQYSPPIAGFVKNWFKGTISDEDLKNTLIEHPFQPSYLFEHCVVPLRKLPIKGVIWYQGEANVRHSFEDNSRKMVDMIKAWRACFQQPELPFFMVQLPRIGALPANAAQAARQDFNWPRYRAAQQDAIDQLEHAALICTLDLGELNNNIHPSPKAPVGQRLANRALTDYYGIDKAQSARILSYQWTARGAKLQLDREVESTGEAQGFEISYDGGKSFEAAAASIKGKNILLRMTSPSKHNTLQQKGIIRYNYKTTMMPNIVTKGSDLPLFPWISKKPI